MQIGEVGDPTIGRAALDRASRSIPGTDRGPHSLRGDDRPACLCTPRISANGPNILDDLGSALPLLPGGQAVNGSHGQD
jgi:hypothetical protein